VKTERANNGKFFLRGPSWGKWIALAGVMIALGGLQWLHLLRPPRGTELYLHEGNYRVTTVRDAITFDCEPLELASRTDDAPEQLTVRLLGVDLPEPRRPASPANEAALRATLDFLRDCPDRVVYLQFARHRFDRSLTPLATLQVRDRQLHLELLDRGLVREAAVPGQRPRR
jgi:hypothetical protein